MITGIFVKVFWDVLELLITLLIQKKRRVLKRSVTVTESHVNWVKHETVESVITTGPRDTWRLHLLRDYNNNI